MNFAAKKIIILSKMNLTKKNSYIVQNCKKKLKELTSKFIERVQGGSPANSFTGLWPDFDNFSDLLLDIYLFLRCVLNVQKSLKFFSNKTCGEFSPHVLLLISAKKRVVDIKKNVKIFKKNLFSVENSIFVEEHSPKDVSVIAKKPNFKRFVK